MSKEKHTASKKRFYIPRAVAAVLVIVLAFGACGAAYALDVGGIQRTIQIWTHGEQTNAVFTVENGEYTLNYTDADGNEVHQGGGGVAYDFFGRERPLTEEELLAVANDSMPDVFYNNDGSVWVYYKNQKLDITNKFENGFCLVEIKTDDGPLYLTVKYRDGYACSTEKYVQPEEF